MNPVEFPMNGDSISSFFRKVFASSILVKTPIILLNQAKIRPRTDLAARLFSSRKRMKLL